MVLLRSGVLFDIQIFSLKRRFRVSAVFWTTPPICLHLMGWMHSLCFFWSTANCTLVMHLSGVQLYNKENLYPCLSWREYHPTCGAMRNACVSIHFIHRIPYYFFYFAWVLQAWFVLPPSIIVDIITGSKCHRLYFLLAGTRRKLRMVFLLAVPKLFKRTSKKWGVRLRHPLSGCYSGVWHLHRMTAFYSTDLGVIIFTTGGRGVWCEKNTNATNSLVHCLGIFPRPDVLAFSGSVVCSVAILNCSYCWNHNSSLQHHPCHQKVKN